ncbi:hypothetical protein PTKIN_Ptkin06aG0120100 [Pterospermum kingtungense]
MENQWHTFITWSFVQKCWEEVGLLHEVNEMAEVKQSQSSEQSTVIRPEICEKWHKPSNSYVKCNVDAAFFESVQKVGAGMCLRDANGHFIAGCSKFMDEGEALALLEAIQWVRLLGYEKVVFEVYAKYVVDAILSNQKDLSEFGFIIYACRSLLNVEARYFVRFMRRSANELAHALAKAAHVSVGSHVWLDLPSPFTILLNSVCSAFDHE